MFSDKNVLPPAKADWAPTEFYAYAKFSSNLANNS